ncbi:MAG: rhomboid family intramembrane serine protease [Solirubrobacteraceae bacterium]|nr:rhomboid family intramembrane serine protease [Patulibacter sp.]
MRFSGTDIDDQGPWFTLGKVEVTTTTLILLVWAVTLLLWTVAPSTQDKLWMTSFDVENGEIWRFVTWPFAHAQFGLGEIIGAAIFWLFGTQIELQLGRRAYSLLLGASLLVIGVVAAIISLIAPWTFGFADLALLELVVVLLFIAEHPTAPFFFNIPAWVIGAVIVALELINDLHDRDWIQLLTVLISAGLIALVARSAGMLSMYDRIPELSLPSRPRRKRDSGGLSEYGRGPARGTTTAEPKRPGSLWGRKKDSGDPAPIVPMPQEPRRRSPIEPTVPDDVSVDDIALDLLLDKISESGLDSLTTAERQALDDLRARRRSK